MKDNSREELHFSLMDTRQVSEFLGISRTMVGKIVHNGHLNPITSFLKLNVFLREDIETAAGIERLNTGPGKAREGVEALETPEEVIEYILTNQEHITRITLCKNDLDAIRCGGYHAGSSRTGYLSEIIPSTCVVEFNDGTKMCSDKLSAQSFRQSHSDKKTAFINATGIDPGVIHGSDSQSVLRISQLKNVWAADETPSVFQEDSGDVEITTFFHQLRGMPVFLLTEQRKKQLSSAVLSQLHKLLPTPLATFYVDEQQQKGQALGIIDYTKDSEKPGQNHFPRTFRIVFEAANGYSLWLDGGNKRPATQGESRSIIELLEDSGWEVDTTDADSGVRSWLSHRATPQPITVDYIRRSKQWA